MTSSDTEKFTGQTHEPLESTETRLEEELSHVKPSEMMRTIKSSQEKGTSNETLSMHKRAAWRETPCKVVNKDDAKKNVGADQGSDNARAQTIREKLYESNLRRGEELVLRLRMPALEMVKLHRGNMKLVLIHRLQRPPKLQKQGTCHDAAATKAVGATQHNGIVGALGHISNNIGNKPARTRQIQSRGKKTLKTPETYMQMEVNEGG